MLRQGHLEAALHVMDYLKLRRNTKLAFEPSYPNIDYSNLQECDWTDFYEGAVESIPPNAPLEVENKVDLCMFVDSIHTGNEQTRRSITGFMVYMNMSLIN